MDVFEYEVQERRDSKKLRGDGARKGIHQDLIASVGLVRDVHEVTDLGSVNLFILGGNEHRGAAHELELGARDGAALEEAVDDVDGEVQRLGAELKLEVHLDEPVNEDLTHLGVDVRLLLHVRRGGGPNTLSGQRVP